MESPINPAVWRVMFHAAVGTLTVGMLTSIWHKKYDMLTTAKPLICKLRSLNKNDEEEKEDILHELLGELQADAAKRSASWRLSTMKYGAEIINATRLAKDGSNTASVQTALKILLRVFSPDAEGRCKLYKYGGYKVLLVTLSEAHKQGNEELMNETAAALKKLTVVNDEEVILENDVPHGAEGAYALAKMPATVKMLRILDPHGSNLFLESLTGIYANVCTLHCGAVNVGKGTDGHSGVSYFLQLLEHADRHVAQNCILVIRFMARYKIGHDEIADLENVTRLVSWLRANGEVATNSYILTIIIIMTASATHAEQFLTHFAQTPGVNELFNIRVRSADRVLRSKAATLCGMMMRLEPTAQITAALFIRYRAQIEERAMKDQEEEKRQAQQMMQNEFMQRMMMEQMGMM